MAGRLGLLAKPEAVDSGAPEGSGEVWWVDQMHYLQKLEKHSETKIIAFFPYLDRYEHTMKRPAVGIGNL